MQVHTPQCSLPGHIDGYLSSPDIRGTLDIVWTCLTTLLLCTWTVLHLNIPIELQASEGRVQSWHRFLYLAIRKLQWMGITLAAPEVILGMALMDLVSARRTTQLAQEYASADGVQWTLMHSFLANMGGFAVEFGDGDETLADSEPASKGPLSTETVSLAGNSKEAVVIPLLETSKNAPAEITASKPEMTASPQEEQTARSASMEMGQGEEDDTKIIHDFWRARMASSKRWRDGVDLWEQCGWPMGPRRWRPHRHNEQTAEEAIWTSKAADVATQKHTTYWYNIRALRGNVWILDARQLLAARERGLIRALPRTSSDEIEDRSKSDALVKVLTAGQVLWLVIQLILRAAQGLAVTQLEIVTLAFALCSLATYAALLHKPKDVGGRVYVRAARAASAGDMKVLARLGPTTFWYLRATTWVPNNSVHYLDAGNIRWLRPLSGYSPLQIGIMVTMVLSVPFGAVHLLSWNSEFPTKGEQLGWHIACLLTIGVPFPLMAAMMYGAEEQRKIFRLSLATTKTIVAWQIGVCMALQVLGRLFVLVEAFRSLGSQPDTAFITTEISVVPHVG